MDIHTLTPIFKALSDENRLAILKLLLSLHPDEVSCQTILDRFPLAQPTLSHHLIKLVAAKILTVRKAGTSHFYTINLEFLKTHGIDIQNNS